MISSKNIKNFFNDTFFNCNYGNQIFIFASLGIILLIFRQFELTYSIGANKHLNAIQDILFILPLFCMIKYYYDKKMFIMAYIFLFFLPLFYYFTTYLLYKYFMV